MLAAAQKGTKAVKSPERNDKYKPTTITAYFQRLPTPKRPQEVNGQSPTATSKEQKLPMATSTSAGFITQKERLACKKDHSTSMRDRVSSKTDSRRDHNSKTDQMSATTHHHPIHTSPSDKLARFEYNKKSCTKYSISGSTTLAPSPSLPSPVSKPKLSIPSSTSKVRASTFIPLDLPRRSIDGSNKRKTIVSKISSPRNEDFPMQLSTPVSLSTTMKSQPPHSLARGAISPHSPKARGARSPLTLKSRGARSPLTPKASSPRSRHSSTAEGSDSFKPVKHFTFPDVSKSKASILSHDVSPVSVSRIPTPLKPVPIPSSLKPVPIPCPLKPVPITPPTKPDVIELLSDSDSSGGKRVVPGIKRIKASENMAVKRICLEGPDHRNKLGSMKRPLSISSDEECMLNRNSKRPLVVDLTSLPARNVGVIDLTGENPRSRKKKRKKHSSDPLHNTCDPASRVKKAFHDRKRHNSDQWSRPHSLSSDPDLTPELPSLKSRFILPISNDSNTCTSPPAKKTLFESDSHLDRTPPLYPITLIDISDDECPTPVRVQSEIQSPKTSKARIRPEPLTSPKGGIVTSKAPSATKNTLSLSETKSPLNRAVAELPRAVFPPKTFKAQILPESLTSPKSSMVASSDTKTTSKIESPLNKAVTELPRAVLPLKTSEAQIRPESSTSPKSGKVASKAPSDTRITDSLSKTDSPLNKAVTELPRAMLTSKAQIRPELMTSPKSSKVALKIPSDTRNTDSLSKTESPLNRAVNELPRTVLPSPKPKALFSSPKGCVSQHPRCKTSAASELSSPKSVKKELPSPAKRDLTFPKTTHSVSPSPKRLSPPSLNIASTKIISPKVVITKIPTKSPPKLLKTKAASPNIVRTSPKTKSPVQAANTLSPKAALSVKPILDEIFQPCVGASPRPKVDCLPPEESQTAECHQKAHHQVEATRGEDTVSSGECKSPKALGKEIKNVAEEALCTEAIANNTTRLSRDEEDSDDALQGTTALDKGCRMDTDPSPAPQTDPNSASWIDPSPAPCTDPAPQTDPRPGPPVSGRTEEEACKDAVTEHGCRDNSVHSEALGSLAVLGNGTAAGGWKDTPLSEVHLVMGGRKLSSSVLAEEVKMLSAAQTSMVSNRLDEHSRISAYHFCSLVDHLRLVTPSSRMLPANLLKSFWDYLLKLKTLTSQPDMLFLCQQFLREFLVLHPPGQHDLVDAQYSSFLHTLGQDRLGAFALWEHLESLIRTFPELGGFLVDLLVADLLAALKTDRSTPPLFVGVFWPGSTGNHITSPIRALIENISLLVCSKTCSAEEASQLKDFMSLLYLVNTTCTDLTTELILACKRFPSSQHLLRFTSHLYSDSLLTQLQTSLPQLKEACSMHASLVCVETGKLPGFVRPVKLVPTPLPPLEHRPRKKTKSATSEKAMSDSGPLSAQDSGVGSRPGTSGGKPESSSSKISPPKSAKLASVQNPFNPSERRRKSDTMPSPKSAGIGLMRQGSASIRSQSLSSQEGSSSSSSAVKGKGQSPHSKRKLFPGDIRPPSSRPRAISFDSTTRKHLEGRSPLLSPSPNHVPRNGKVKVQPLPQVNYAKKKMVSHTKSIERKGHEVTHSKASGNKWESLAKSVGKFHLEGGDHRLESLSSKRATELVHACKSSSPSEKRRRSEPWFSSEVGLSKPSFGPHSAAAAHSSRNRPPNFAKSFFTQSKRRRTLPEEINQHTLKVLNRVRSPNPQDS